MIIKMREMMKRQDDQKGFTLVELIIVMAILGILAAIAVPKYSGIKATAAVKADAATAASIVQAARIQENDTGTKVAAGNLGAGSTILDSKYFDSTVIPQSGGTFALSGGEGSSYEVKWTPSKAGTNDVEQTVTEGVAFALKVKS